MIDLTKTTQITKRFGVLAVIVIVVVFLMAVIFLQFRNNQAKPAALDTPPSPPAIYQDPSQKNPQTINLSDAQIGQIPQNLPTYSAKTYDFTQKNLADLASLFGFTDQPFLIEDQTFEGKQTTWKKDSSYLVVNGTNIRFEDFNYAANGNSLTQDQLQQKAFDYLKNVPVLGGDFALQNTNYLTVSSSGNDSGYKSASSFEEANLIEFTFNKTLSNFPLYAGTPDNTFAKIRITKDGTVKYMASKLFKSFEQGSPFSLKSESEAITEIKNGQGKIIQTQLLDKNGQALELFSIQPQNINLANIKDLSIAYLLPPDISNPIQPVFIAEGEFQNNQGQTGKVYIYLPAFKGQITSIQP